MRTKKRYWILAGLSALGALTIADAPAQQPAAAPRVFKQDYPIQPVPLGAVRLTDDLWGARLDQDFGVDVKNALANQERVGEFRNFRRAAGALGGTYEGNRNNDSDVYKVLQGVSELLASANYAGESQTPARGEMTKFADDLTSSIVAAQQPDGYLMTSHIVPGAPGGFVPPGDHGHFTNESASHEFYSLGHLYEAAVALNLATGDNRLLGAAQKSANLLINTFSPGKRLDPPGHEEIELALCKLYRDTGEKKYLDQAKFFIDQRGNAEGHRLYGTYAQDDKPVKDQTEAVGHAVRAGYLYSGVTDVTALSGDLADLPALNKLWDDVVGDKLYITGGVGARARIEGFGADYELPNDTAYCETCAAIANAYWNQRMFQLTGDAKYLDIVELELFNGVAVGRDNEKALYYYQCPMELRTTRARRPWFTTPCCPTNVIRFTPEVAGMVYATQPGTLFVNQYLADSAAIQVDGNMIHVSQESAYPWDGDIKLTLKLSKPASFALNLRIPGWAQGHPMPGDLYRYFDQVKDTPAISINGQSAPLAIEKGFAQVKREWRDGDVVRLMLPMPIRRVIANGKVAADAGKVTIERGPLVYCADSGDNNGAWMPGMVLDDKAPLTLKAEPLGSLAHFDYIVATMQPVQGGSSGAPGGAAALGTPSQVKLRPYYLTGSAATQSMTVWQARRPEAAELPR